MGSEAVDEFRRILRSVNEVGVEISIAGLIQRVQALEKAIQRIDLEREQEADYEREQREQREP